MSRRTSYRMPLASPFAIAAAWLLACLVLGGASNAAPVANLALQVGAAGLIAWTIWRGSGRSLAAGERGLVAIVALLLLWIGLTLAPLPPALWTRLPGRDFVAAGYRLLGLDLPWLPISLTDDRTLRSALALLAPIATYLAVRRLDAGDRKRLALVVVIFALASFGLGMAQLVGGDASPLRLYRITNRGVPVGLMANANHFATLLLMTIPLAVVAVPSLVRSRKKQDDRPKWSRPGLLAAVLMVVGIGLIGSNAGYLLAVPALAGALLLGPGRAWLRRPAAVRLVMLAGVLSAALVIASAFTGVLQQRAGNSASSRAVVTSTTLAAARHYLPTGAGLGSFAQLYLKQSGGEQSSYEWMNHAHDDVAEVALELGIPGVLLLLAFAAWLGLAAYRAWAAGEFTDDRDGLVRAAALGALLVGIHSFVDYPLRTAAIAALFAMLLAFLSGPPRAGERP